MTKKILITTLLFGLVLAAGATWLLFFQKSDKVDQPTNNSFIDNLFPFGRGEDAVVNPTVTPNEEQKEAPVVPDDGSVLRLRKIHNLPVAGAISFKGDGVTIRYVERATGHIYETRADNASVTRLSNTTIPKVYEAFWSNNGKEALLRYLRDDDNTTRTFYTKIATSSEDQTIDGLFLDDGIKNISVQGNRIFYFDKSGSEFRGITSLFDGSKKTAVFSSGFGDFNHSWISPNSILLYTAPVTGRGGVVYTLNPTSGVYKKVFSGATGVSGITNPSGTSVFVSSGGTTINSFVLNLATLTTKTLSIGTLADKCVWGTKTAGSVYCAVPKAIPAADYPDAWYRGAVSFNDRLWRIDTETGETDLVFDPIIESGEEIDMINLALDPEEKTILFLNKKDLSLWVYQLEI